MVHFTVDSNKHKDKGWGWTKINGGSLSLNWSWVAKTFFSQFFHEESKFAKIFEKKAPFGGRPCHSIKNSQKSSFLLYLTGEIFSLKMTKEKVVPHKIWLGVKKKFAKKSFSYQKIEPKCTFYTIFLCKMQKIRISCAPNLHLSWFLVYYHFWSWRTQKNQIFEIWHFFTYSRCV